MLKYYPLSLRLAASVMTQFCLSAAQYIEKWRMRQLDGEIIKIDYVLGQSFEMSFKTLRNTEPLAAKLLTLFGFLDHQDMWY